MRSEIEQLRTQNQHTEKILAALVSNDRSEEVLEHLRSGQTIDMILEMLDLDESEDNGKRKEREHDHSFSGNVTTYPRPGASHSILQAVKQSQSLASSPPSTAAFSETYQSTQRPGNWPTWDDEAYRKRSLQCLRDQMYICLGFL